MENLVGNYFINNFRVDYLAFMVFVWLPGWQCSMIQVGLVTYGGKTLSLKIHQTFIQGGLCPRKSSTHPDIAHPIGNPRSQLWKKSHKGPVGKGCLGCVPVRCVETTIDSGNPMNLQKQGNRMIQQVVPARDGELTGGFSNPRKQPYMVGKNSYKWGES